MTEHSRTITIGVVDDDPRILESLENLLESADYAVRVFVSGKALLESGCVAKIDCLISDIGMPDMDGFALLRAVHAARPELATIFITGQAGVPGRSRLARVGGHRVFNKPFDGEELLAAVADAVRKSRASELRL
jgi:FixJ family two-component response regulator